MKSIIVVFSMIITLSAVARPNTTKMTCRDAADLVDQNRAIVLSTSDHTYDRFVNHSSLCGGGEVASNAFVSTLDKKTCLIGFVCSERSGSNGGSSVIGAKPVSCKEGSLEQLNQRDRGDINFVPIFRKCVGGKWQIIK